MLTPKEHLKHKMYFTNRTLPDYLLSRYSTQNFGTGNYSSKIQENLYDSGSRTESTMFGQMDTPFYYKLGARIPFNR